MQNSHSDGAFLLNDVRENNAHFLQLKQFNEVLFTNIKQLGVWIWTNKWLITSLLVVLLNVSMYSMSRQSARNSFLNNDLKKKQFHFLDVKFTLDEYTATKNFCEYIYCTSDLCYCIPHTRENWLSAKALCHSNLKNGNLAMKVSDSIVDATIHHGRVNIYYESWLLSLWLGAFVNFEGKSFWINNESYKHETVPVNHCVVKDGNHFIRNACRDLNPFSVFICKSKNASCETSDCPLIAAKGSTKYCQLNSLHSFNVHMHYFNMFTSLPKVCVDKCKNSQLLYLESSAEIDFILSNISGNFFIGATDYSGIGNWKWIGDMPGINFGEVPQFLDRYITSGYYIRITKPDFVIIESSVASVKHFLCQFPNEFSKDGIIPISFLYSKMGAPKCQHLSCSKDFHKCYCFFERINQNLDCNSFSHWNFLTIYDEKELNHVQSLLKGNESGWRIGANNFIERSIFQWTDTRGMDIPLLPDKDKYNCLAISRRGLHQLPCEEATRWVCTLIYSELERS